MSQINYNTKNNYSHLTNFERGKIEAYLSENKTISYIANKLNRSRSTIKREIDRNSVIQIKNINGYDKEVKVYYSETATILYEKRREKSVLKPLVKYSEKFFKELHKALTTTPRCHSVETFVEVYKRTNPLEKIPCFKTIYRYIHDGIIKLSPMDLPRMVRFRKKSDKKITPRKNKKVYGISIEERPLDVEKRLEIGHWEIDTVIGKKGKSENVLLTLTERKTRFEIIYKLDNKSSYLVNNVLEHIISAYPKEIFKSITSDNGSEFSRLYEFEYYGLNIYYAHAYSSFERGTNEVHNAMIREFLPKGKSFNNIDNEYIQKVENSLNKRPRRMFDFKTPEELFEEELSLL